MRYKILYFTLLLLYLFLSSQNCLADSNRSKSFSISFNSAKLLFMRLVNLEFEYQLSSRCSVRIFAELLLKEADHPNLVISLGPRYYFSPCDDNVSGFYTGVSLGYVWYKEGSGASSPTVGSELGYKLFFGDRFFILLRGLITYPVKSARFLLGAELMTGALLP